MDLAYVHENEFFREALLGFFAQSSPPDTGKWGGSDEAAGGVGKKMSKKLKKS